MRGTATAVKGWEWSALFLPYAAWGAVWVTIVGQNKTLGNMFGEPLWLGALVTALYLVLRWAGVRYIPVRVARALSLVLGCVAGLLIAVLLPGMGEALVAP